MPFAADVTKCAATASPTSAVDSPLVVTTGGDGKSLVVTEPGAPAAVGFHLQVTC